MFNRAYWCVLMSLIFSSLCAGPGCSPEPPSAPLLVESFGEDPVTRGWTGEHGSSNRPAEWMADPQATAGQAVTIHYPSTLLGPAFPVEPFAYYALHFRYRSSARGLVAMLSRNDDGVREDVDAYDGYPPSESWREEVRYFRPFAFSKSAQLAFRAIGTDQFLTLDSLQVNRASPEAVRAWMDEVYATMPPLSFEPPENRWTHLESLKRRLSAPRAEPLRVLLLGDSIMNDLGNSLFEVLLTDDYPRLQVEMIHSVRSASGSPYFRQPGKVDDYVLRYRPDVVLIGGTSHDHDLEAVRDVVRQIRDARPDIPLILLSGVFGHEDGIPQKVDEANQADCPETTFSRGLKRLAGEEQTGFWDLRTAFENHLADHAIDYASLKRDQVHANTLGKQILARVMQAWYEWET